MALEPGATIGDYGPYLERNLVLKASFLLNHFLNLVPMAFSLAREKAMGTKLAISKGEALGTRLFGTCFLVD